MGRQQHQRLGPSVSSGRARTAAGKILATGAGAVAIRLEKLQRPVALKCKSTDATPLLPVFSYLLNFCCLRMPKIERNAPTISQKRTNLLLPKRSWIISDSGSSFTTILDCHRGWPSGEGISPRDCRGSSSATERFPQACKNAYGHYLST